MSIPFPQHPPSSSTQKAFWLQLGVAWTPQIPWSSGFFLDGLLVDFAVLVLVCTNIQPRETRKSKFSSTVCLQTWVLRCDTKTSSRKLEVTFKVVEIQATKRVFNSKAMQGMCCHVWNKHLKSIWGTIELYQSCWPLEVIVSNAFFQNQAIRWIIQIVISRLKFPHIIRRENTVSSPRKCGWIIIICLKSMGFFQQISATPSGNDFTSTSIYIYIHDTCFFT